MRRRLVAVVGVMALVVGISVVMMTGPSITPAAALPTGGPVILGGDDTPDHGSANLGTSPATLNAAWRYMKLAIESITPNVTRTNDGSIALVGSCPTGTYSPGSVVGDSNGGVGGAYGLIATLLSGGPRTVNYVEGGAAIDTFFSDLDAGTVNPAIVIIAGDQTGNDLQDNCGASNGSPNAEKTALTNNAAFLANYVNEGGGLLSHGTYYGWLNALFPAITTSTSSTTSRIHITSDGATLWPGLTDNDVSSAWHNYFGGDLGSLKVLGQAANNASPFTPITETDGSPRGVIIGGTNVTLPVGITASPSTASLATGNQVCINALVTTGVGGAGSPVSGATVTFTIAGANSATTTVTSASDGTAQFCYTGLNPGVDTATVSYVNGGTNGVTQTSVTYTGSVITTTTTSTTTTTAAPTTTTTVPATTTTTPPVTFPPPQAHGGGAPVSIEGGQLNIAPVATPPTPAVNVAVTPSGDGSWTVTKDGGVFTAGDAGFFGSAASLKLAAPATDIVPTASGQGYFVVAADGGVFAFGDARFEGSMAGTKLNQPVTGIVRTCQNDGYFLVASDGGVFTFGGAQFHGSMGGLNLNREMFGIVPNCAGGGYWTVARDGGVFSFGNANFYGSLGSTPPPSGTIAMIPTSDDHGYWLVDGTRTVHRFGNAS